MWRGHAFGVELAAAAPVDVVVPGPGSGRTPVVAVAEAPAAELDAAWPPGARTLVDERHPDGSPFLAVEGHPTAGWRIRAPGHGTHVVAPDGSGLRASAGALGPAGRRLLTSQALPTLAAAHGLVCLHAAGVVAGGRAVALLGPSGVGKSTISAALVDAGAAFLADDVVAVALDGGTAWAQPGTRTRRVGGGAEGVEGEKALVLIDDVAHEAPLDVLVWLERGDPGEPLALADVVADADRLLGSAFLVHLDAPALLVATLDVAAHLGAHARALRLRVPEGADPRSSAAAVLETLG